VKIPIKYLRWFHAFATGVWLALVIPTVMFWSESIAWLAIMSVWANVAGHFGSWQGARAESVADPSTD
jgi:hypothetical protein